MTNYSTVRERDPVNRNPGKVYSEDVGSQKKQAFDEQPLNNGFDKLNDAEKNNGLQEDNVPKAYPKVVFLIIANEFCERFSYYGIRTVLYIYLTEFIGINKDTATAIYHAFTMLCYFSPLMGAIIADGYIGLYRTILYVSCFYLLGETVLTLTSIGPLGAPNIWGPAIGLIIIALGTGGNTRFSFKKIISKLLKIIRNDEEYFLQKKLNLKI
jgi:dipeptide/tripeptide permease